mmetsp:Transcript_3739/g.13838  ORF Transcript_3739/g.13838 Transcript_3739/m.13838 type:complete len:511 (-) Transcript_3739:113-1645(-)
MPAAPAAAPRRQEASPPPEVALLPHTPGRRVKLTCGVGSPATSCTTQDSDGSCLESLTATSSLPSSSLSPEGRALPGPSTASVARRLDLRTAPWPVPSGRGLQHPLLNRVDTISDTELCHSLSDESQRVYWEVFFVVFPMFCGYAALFGMQHHVKTKLGIQDDNSEKSYEFGFAVSTVYLSNLLIRFGHSFLFCCIPPRGRVFISMGLMIASVLVIAGPIFIFDSCHMYWVVIAYFLGGMGIGSFESNMLGCLTPFGHRTKHVAITAIPAGVNAVLIGGFFAMGPPFNAPPVLVYLAVASSILCGMVVMSLRIPRGSACRTPSSDNMAPLSSQGRFGRGKLWSDLRLFRAWLPQLWHHALASTVNLFALSAFCPGVMLYVYNTDTVALAPGVVVKTDSFMALVNAGNLLGGLTGRWLSYRLTPRHPMLYGCFSAAGICLILQWQPCLAPLGTFLVLMGDGLIYGSISRFIDASIPQEFNVIAISAWLFIGDLGSILGSSLTNSIRNVVAR